MSVDNKHISIHTPLAGSDRWPAGTSSLGSISIHTPLAGSDKAHSHGVPQQTDFNPHSPCGERLADFYTYWQGEEFQSTLPLRGATFHSRHSGHPESFQSTLPLRGATTGHTLFLPASKFQSTLPLRGATASSTDVIDTLQISIHTPLAGSDSAAVHSGFPQMAISIHTPLAGSDMHQMRQGHEMKISIHTPLAGSDEWTRLWKGWCQHFNPHSPCGERRITPKARTTRSRFQSTLPLRGATRLK